MLSTTRRHLPPFRRLRPVSAIKIAPLAFLLTGVIAGAAACTSEQREEILNPGPGAGESDWKRGVIVGPGGKVTAATLDHWEPDTTYVTTHMVWRRYPVTTPIPPGARVTNVVLSGAPNIASARIANGSVSRASAAVTTPNHVAALFTGGFEASADATRIAVLVEPRADTAAPFVTTSLQLTEARSYHSATGLSSGDVLIVGGYSPADVVLRTAERFSLSGNTFSATGSMRIGRARHAAALLPNGRVLVTGGEVTQANGSITATTEIFDAVSGTFSDGPAMTVARFNHSAITLDDGRVLVLGGNGLRSAEVYSPATNSFTRVGDMSVNHGLGHQAVKLPSGKVLVLGGDAGVIQPTAVAELFDPATNAFTSVGNMTSSRMNHFAVLVADKLVMIGGGQNATGDILASTEVFDIATNTFTATTDLTLSGTERGAAYLMRNP